MAQTINTAFPVLSISAEDITDNWLSQNCISFFFCCSLEATSSAGDDFEFRLACYSQNLQQNEDSSQALTFELLTPQPQPVGGNTPPVDLSLTNLVLNDMYIRYDDLKAIVESSPQAQIEFYPATGGVANNIAYTLKSGNNSDPVQLNPCPPANAYVIE